MLWSDLKKSSELKLLCKEEKAEIHPQRCERLIASYHKHLIKFLSVKDGKQPKNVFDNLQHVNMTNIKKTKKSGRGQMLFSSNVCTGRYCRLHIL